VNTIGSFGARYGRLGNQVFQLGLLFAIRQHLGRDFYLPRDEEELWECFDLDVADSGPPCPHKFQEVNGSCNYDARVFEQPDGTRFHGYYQSYRYLDGCEEALRRFLRFHVRHRARAEALRFVYERRHRRPLVSVHVRRGDYVRPESEAAWGNLATDGYYERAVERIGHDVTYLVFSDDLDWCRRSLGIPDAQFADYDTATSLCLMSRCDVNIVANSTFSWWAAYLNPTGEIYAPSRWFGPGMEPPNDRQDDILPATWRTIPTFTGCAESA
jgi:hypothetical protein